jgi:predicted transcriptional regulator
MMVSTKPLLSLSAADLMSRTLAIVPREMSLSGAARLLSRAQVTGAPVVDAEGCCIGVISATDFLNWVEHDRRPVPDPQACVCSPWQIIEPDKLPNCKVEDLMTRDPVTAGASARIIDLARMMIDAHIHRIIVVDERCRPLGIVSSTDILAAVAGSE